MALSLLGVGAFVFLGIGTETPMVIGGVFPTRHCDSSMCGVSVRFNVSRIFLLVGRTWNQDRKKLINSV
jgi:hypothetical protein